MELEKLIYDFLSYCEIERGHSKHTIINYNHYLKRFLNWAKTNHISNPAQIDLEKVKTYRLYLNRLEGINKKTQAFHVIALRAFLKYLATRDIQTLAAEKIQLPSIPEREITFLEEDELEKLLSMPDDQKNIIGLRDKAILEMLFSTGLRVSELIRLNRDDINLNRREFSVIGKGGKARVVFLSDRAIKAIDHYLDKRQDNDIALFVSHQKIRKTGKWRNGKMGERDVNDRRRLDGDRSQLRLTTRSVQRIVKKYATQAGLTKKITPHTMRHSFGTDLLRSGADIRAVQQLLGHSSITTTQIYTHVTDQHLKEVHQAFHGVRRRTGTK